MSIQKLHNITFLIFGTRYKLLNISRLGKVRLTPRELLEANPKMTQMFELKKL